MSRFEDEIAAAIAERAQRLVTDDSHLEVQTIVAYYESQLDEDAEEEVRDHLGICRECSDLLLDLHSFNQPLGLVEQLGITFRRWGAPARGVLVWLRSSCRRP